MMSAPMFSDSSVVNHDGDIPDIFDVLEGGEDEGAVKFLLGFNASDGMGVESFVGFGSTNDQAIISTTTSLPPMSATLHQQLKHPDHKSTNVRESTSTPDSILTKEGKVRKREPVDPSRCIFACESCTKAFTTKFNLKRHINLHCDKSKEAGVPVQGPPSASTPSRKARERKEADSTSGFDQQPPRPMINLKKRSAKSTKGKSKRTDKVPKHQEPNTTSSSSLSSPVSDSSLVGTSGVGHDGYHQPMSNQIDSQDYHQQSSFQLYAPTGQDFETGARSQFSNTSNSIPVNSQHRIVYSQSGYDPPSANSNQIQSVGGNNFGQTRLVQIVQQNQNQHQLFQPHQGTLIGQLQTSSGSIPVQYQAGTPRVFRAVPVSIVPSGGSKGLLSRAIQLPQQPLPIVHSLQPGHQLRPLSNTPQTNSVLSMSTSKFSQVQMNTNNQRGPQIQQQVFVRPMSTLTNPILVSSSSLVSTGSSLVSTGRGSIIHSSNHPSSILTSPSSMIHSSNPSSILHTTNPSSTLTSPSSIVPTGPPEDLFASDDGGSTASSQIRSPQSQGESHQSAMKSIPDGSTPMPDSNNLDDGDFRQTPDRTSRTLNDFFDSSGCIAYNSNGFVTSQVDSQHQFSMLNLPSNPPRGILQEIPRGWVRKQVSTGKGQRVFYYNTMGKKFSTYEEINQYFSRLGQSVKPGLFNFEPARYQDDLARLNGGHQDH